MGDDGDRIPELNEGNNDEPRTFTIVAPSATSGNDDVTLFASTSFDALEGDDTVRGSSSSDTILGNSGADTINALGGDDTVQGGLGDDSLDGGGDTDTVSFADMTAASSISGGVSLGATVNLGTATAQNTGYGSDTIANFENAEGTQFVDFLTGDASANTLSGEGGGDLLRGDGGVDVLYGGEGNDVLVGGEGVDSLFGGDGAADLAAYLGVTDGDPSTPAIDPFVIDMRTPMNDPGNLSSAIVREDVIGADVEGFLGPTGLGGVYHSEGSFPYILGGNQDDTFFGGTGVDQLIAQGGNDLMIGGANQDALNGGNGDDDLWGGLQGGTGDGILDLFLFDDADGNDTIHDFEAGTDALMFYGDAISGLGDLTVAAFDQDGDTVLDDTLVTYSAAGFTSTVTILSTAPGDVTSGLIFF